MGCAGVEHSRSLPWLVLRTAAEASARSSPVRLGPTPPRLAAPWRQRARVKPSPPTTCAMALPGRYSLLCCYSRRDAARFPGVGGRQRSSQQSASDPATARRWALDRGHDWTTSIGYMAFVCLPAPLVPRSQPPRRPVLVASTRPPPPRVQRSSIHDSKAHSRGGSASSSRRDPRCSPFSSPTTSEPSVEVLLRLLLPRIDLSPPSHR
jgi:hypothetical protein